MTSTFSLFTFHFSLSISVLVWSVKPQQMVQVKDG